MRHEIVLAPEAVQDLRRLRAHQRARVRDAMEKHLRHRPADAIGHVQRLRGVSHPQFRLRVGDIRVFYDVTGDAVEILAIVAKPDAAAWLERFGEP